MQHNMSYHTFNTHEHIKALTKAGMQEEQAEVIIKSLLESRDYDFSKLATKEQLGLVEEKLGLVEEKLGSKIDALRSEFKNELKVEVAELKAEIAGVKAGIEASHNSILRWMIPLLFTIIGMVAAAIFKMLGH